MLFVVQRPEPIDRVPIGDSLTGYGEESGSIKVSSMAQTPDDVQSIEISRYAGTHNDFLHRTCTNETVLKSSVQNLVR